MGKNVGLTYVKDFEFPAEQGFTGSTSSGVHKVSGYMRGGHVKQPVGKGGARQKMPQNVKKHGGVVKKQMGGSVGLGRMGGVGQDREISVDDVRISVPKKHGGKMSSHNKTSSHNKMSSHNKTSSHMKHGGKVETSSHNKMSTHDKLYHEGGKMGYAHGGQVKDTSREFVETRGKQDTMDTGNQPARRGRNQAEIEAGGTKRLKPGLNKGGYMKGSVHKVRASSRRKASGKGMPKNVKAHGGLARYADGGVVKKAGAAQ